MVTTQTADSVLKSYYLGVVTDQLDKSANPFLAMVKKTTSDVWGRDVRKVVRIGLNGGIGAGTETGDLPPASGNHYAQLVSTLKNLYGTIEISDKAIRASANSEGAFVNLLNDEMESLVKSSSFNFGRMLYGDGSGTLASITSSTSDGKITVSSVQNLAEGMVVDIVNTSDEIVESGRTIQDIDRNEKKVVLFGTPIEPMRLTNTRFVIHGSLNLEITGLNAIFSNKNIYGVKRGENAWFKPYVKTGVGKLTENMILEAIDDIEKNTGSKINVILCSYEVRRYIYSLLAAKGYTTTGVELEGGYKTIAINGIPVIADRFCPETSLFLLNTDDFALHQLCDWQWLEGEDGKVLKQIAGKPVYTATLVKYAELMCYRPCGQGMLSGINGADLS